MAALIPLDQFAEGVVVVDSEAAEAWIPTQPFDHGTRFFVEDRGSQAEESLFRQHDVDRLEARDRTARLGIGQLESLEALPLRVTSNCAASLGENDLDIEARRVGG